jgi:hypothetical protein
LVVQAYERFVGGPKRFRELVAANFLGVPNGDRRALGAWLASAADEVTDDDLAELFAVVDWKPRLIASWLVAVDRRQSWRPMIRELMLGGELISAPQGYCVALLRFGTPADAAILADVLGWSRPTALDLDWAMAALLILDERHGTSLAEPILAADGPWRQWCASMHMTDTKPDAALRNLEAVESFLDRLGA